MSTTLDPRPDGPVVAERPLPGRPRSYEFPGVTTQLLANGLASVARDAMRDEGVFIYRAHGGIRKRQGSFPGKPATPTTANTAPTWSDSSAVKLAPEDALALQLEMRTLFERYVHKNSARGRFFVMRTALAPITDDDVPSIPR